MFPDIYRTPHIVVGKGALRWTSVMIFFRKPTAADLIQWKISLIEEGVDVVDVAILLKDPQKPTRRLKVGRSVRRNEDRMPEVQGSGL